MKSSQSTDDMADVVNALASAIRESKTLKRHVCLVIQSPPKLTNRIVLGVQTFVADAVAGFCGDDYPNTKCRKYASDTLRNSRRENWLETQEIMRRDYLSRR
jgi:hypothetical protein